MDSNRFDALTRVLSRQETRRGALGALGGAAGLGLGAAAARKSKKPKKKTCRTCCRANASPCRKKSKNCKPGNCLRAPVTIEAVWTNEDSDHDTFFFVPNEAGAALPGPYINYGCNPADSDCEDDVYPFTCVSQDATGAGDEVTTIRQLLAGKYEFWIALHNPSPAGDLTVRLRDEGGREVRSWSSPANPSEEEEIGWHVFDLDGKTGRVTSVDRTIDDDLSQGPHDPSTEVCPGL